MGSPPLGSTIELCQGGCVVVGLCVCWLCVLCVDVCVCGVHVCVCVCVCIRCSCGCVV